MFSKACEYGIRATLHIAVQSKNGKRVSLKEIARETDSPEAFTAKILQTLVRNNIIESVKGPTGGFEINPSQMEKIKLSKIVSAIDGDEIFMGCGLGLKRCNEKMPCPVHDKFKIIREQLRIMLETTNVCDLAFPLSEGMTFLKR